KLPEKNLKNQHKVDTHAKQKRQTQPNQQSHHNNKTSNQNNTQLQKIHGKESNIIANKPSEPTT
ncbi:hypothetical protein RA267_30355, partial [Pseudomonas syringae pv. tagetis]|uniref:hypothetical protein n=1 Tax=Pseudomonas syringae group genomosp. 7 TaxID=251699 RepID=UPI0037704EFE